MNSPVKSVRTHIRNNKVTYIACGVTAVVVAGVTYYVCGNSALVNVRPIQILNWKSHQTIEVVIEALGHPGNVIQDVTDGVGGTIWASQNQAAKALGVLPARISEHLAGKIPDVAGRVLMKIGTASFSDD